MDKLYVIGPEKTGKIAKELYGHFTEHIGGVIYGGIYVGEDSPIPNIRGFRREIIEKMRKISAPVIRWPGGCYAEVYDWRDGIGPRGERPTRISWWTRYDGRYESNEVGTHEFCDFAALCGAKPYFAANITSITPMQVRNWVDYCTSPENSTALAAERASNGSVQPFDIPWWGIGNENWGGGGNMTPEEYGLQFRKYATLVQNAAPQLKLVACGPNAEDWEWSRRFLQTVRDRAGLMNGYALHYYCFNRQDDPLNFGDEDWYRMIWQAGRMQYLIDRHWGYICGYGLESSARLYIDEWGAWHPDGSGPSGGKNLYEQQSTIRDAVISAVYLNIFNNNCDKIDMANCAQLVNNLHCLFLAGGENCITTPTYHVFDMFSSHMGGVCLRTADTAGSIECRDIQGKSSSVKRLSVSASVKDGMLTVTAVNTHTRDDEELELSLCGLKANGEGQLAELFSGRLTDCNSFEEPEKITPAERKITSAELKHLTIRAGGIISLKIPVTED